MQAKKKTMRQFSRRECLSSGLKIGGMASAVLLLNEGCRYPTPVSVGLELASPPWAPPPKDAKQANAVRLLLNRAAFGPRPGEVSQVASQGQAAWLEEQLADKGNEDPFLLWHVNEVDTLQTERDDPNELFAEPNEQLVRDVQKVALLRAIYSRHQLREVMADFWTNHFNIYALKSDGRALVPADAERVIRPHIFGRFEEMLHASAKSPAMLTYLDNRENKKGIPNENYARELMELHTLGVHSGYTQRDVQQVARCFTGWGVGTGFSQAQFRFRPEWHDNEAKFVPFLHLALPAGGGESDGEKVLTALAYHPATAHFLARKLCRHFLGAEPQLLVERAARAYLKDDTSIRAMLRPILFDGLLKPEMCRPILKRPLDLVASAVRCLGAATDGGEGLQQLLEKMGQPLYLWPMPDGFPEKTSSWASAMLPRWQFAFALAFEQILHTEAHLQPLWKMGKGQRLGIVDACLQVVFGMPAEVECLASLRAILLAHLHRAQETGVPEREAHKEILALTLASPEFQWKG